MDFLRWLYCAIYLENFDKFLTEKNVSIQLKKILPGNFLENEMEIDINYSWEFLIFFQISRRNFTEFCMEDPKNIL